MAETEAPVYAESREIPLFAQARTLPHPALEKVGAAETKAPLHPENLEISLFAQTQTSLDSLATISRTLLLVSKNLAHELRRASKN